MRRPPELREIGRYPIVGGVALLAIGVTLASWAKVDVSPLVEDAHLRQGQPWRLVTSILPHVNPLHLIFNVYWLWAFGTLVERAFGPVRTAGLIALMAAGSGAAEYALFDGGVGLSGVGYGLFAFCWVMQSRDARFAGSANRTVVNLFAGWFALCIVMTVACGMPVANVAHAAGAALGALLGFALSAGRAALAGTAAFWLLCLAGATVGRPWVNLSKTAYGDEARMGYDALQAGRDAEGERWYRDATRMRPQVADNWFNLGIALARQGKLDQATNAYERAHRADPANAEYHAAWLAQATRAASAAGRAGDAVRLVEEETRRNPARAATWASSAEAYRAAGRGDDATAALKKAHELEPANREYEARYAGDTAYGELLRKRYDAALPWCVRTTELRPGEPSAWFNLGIAHDALGHEADAAAAYARAAALAPDNKEYQAARAAHPATTPTTTRSPGAMP